MLGAELSSEGISCRGIVFLSPFTSITEVLHHYNMFGFIPLMKPLSVIPGAIGLVQKVLVHRFDTLRAVPNITATSVLIAHAENDWDIPDSHSDILFQAFLERQLPPLDIPSNVLSMSKEDWEIVEGQQKARQDKRNELLKSTTLVNFGRMDEFFEEGRKIVLVKTLAGGHKDLGAQEGLQDIIGHTFAIGL
jgi:abhydrolase domain-containing protein 12